MKKQVSAAQRETSSQIPNERWRALKKLIVRALLRLLNTSQLNPTPGRYMFVGGIGAITFEGLEAEEHQSPGITVAQLIADMRMWQSCPINGNWLTVIEDGTTRDGDIWDVQELSNLR